MAHAQPTSPLSPGDLVAGKYRVERVIGIGGMGAVVAATHVALHQRVAIKVMLTAVLSSDESIERFLREARAVAKLRSAHVPRVLDVATLESGEPYMVMELLEGEDLARLLAREGPLPLADVVDYVRQACEALVEAHGLGIVHRDLKPENLFLARDARGSAHIKVLDFGISKSLDKDQAELALTRTSAVMGSPLYMSPEQMRASRDVDARTDIWSLGVTLYQLIVGEVPFDAESAMALGAKVLHEAPVPPVQRRPEVPAALDAIILRCLEKDPARRFPDAGALAQALVGWRGAQDAASAAPWADAAQTTGPRVSFGAGGTPPAGSRTLPFSETLVATDDGARTRRGVRLPPTALGIAALAVLGAVGLFVRTRVPAMGANEGRTPSVAASPSWPATSESAAVASSSQPPSPGAPGEALAPPAVGSAWAAPSATSSPTESTPGGRPGRPHPRSQPARHDAPERSATPSTAPAPPAPSGTATNPFDHL